MVKKRILWIDFLKLLAIYFVVLGHVILFMGLERNEIAYQNTVCSFVYSFHMPLFMTISGFFSHKIITCEGNIKRKFLQLIVPCISLAIICLIFNIHTLNFWYLKSLFICYVIWDLFFLLFKNKLGIGILVFTVLSLLFFPLLTSIPYIASYKVDFMLPYFGFGLLIYQYRETLNNHITSLSIIAILLFIISLFFWNSSYIWYFSKPNWIDYKSLILEKQFILDFQTLWQTVWRYIVGLLGTCSFLFLCWYIGKRKSRNRIFSLGKYGKYSLHIYIFQSFLVEVNLFHIKFPTENINLYNYLYAPIFSLCIVIICIVIAYILEKNKYIAFLLFGKQIN